MYWEVESGARFWATRGRQGIEGTQDHSTRLSLRAHSWGSGLPWGVGALPPQGELRLTSQEI